MGGCVSCLEYTVDHLPTCICTSCHNCGRCVVWLVKDLHLATVYCEYCTGLANGTVEAYKCVCIDCDVRCEGVYFPKPYFTERDYSPNDPNRPVRCLFCHELAIGEEQACTLNCSKCGSVWKRLYPHRHDPRFSNICTLSYECKWCCEIKNGEIEAIQVKCSSCGVLKDGLFHPSDPRKSKICPACERHQLELEHLRMKTRAVGAQISAVRAQTSAAIFHMINS